MEAQEFINTLKKERDIAEEQIKHRNLKLEGQKQLVLEYKTKCEKLHQRVKSLETELVEKHDQNQITSFKEKLEKSESAFLALQEKHKSLLVKHNHLRKSLVQFLTNFKKAIPENLPTHNLSRILADQSANLHKKLDRLETSRSELVLEFQRNLNVVSSIVKHLGIHIPNKDRALLCPAQNLANVKWKYKCKRCNKQFSYLVHWNRHRRQTHRVTCKGIPCRSCGKVLLSSQKLEEHRRNTHAVQNSKKFLMKKCSARTRQKRSKGTIEQDTFIVPPEFVSDNERRNGDKQNFIEETDVDQLTFPSLETQDVPNSDSSNGENEDHICLCGKKVSSKQHLELHIWYHHTTGKNLCQVCKMAFRTLPQKCAHERLQHGIEQVEVSKSPLNCDVCGKTFFIKINLVEHICFPRPEPVPITSTQPNQCTQKQNVSHSVDQNRTFRGFFCTCGKESSSRYTLAAHIRRFNTRIRFACSQCPRSYSIYHELRVHMRSKHGLDCPGWGCCFCGEIFLTKDEFSVHKRGKSCKQKLTIIKKFGNAERNKITKVARVRKFPCKICQRAFLRRWELRLHLKQTHKQTIVPSKAFGCSLCGRILNSRRLLIKHRKIRHYSNSKHERDCSKRNGWYCQCGSQYRHEKALASHIKYFTMRLSEKTFRTGQKPKRKQSIVTVAKSQSGNASDTAVLEPLSAPIKFQPKPIYSSVSSIIVSSNTKEHGMNVSEDSNKFSCKCGMLFGNKDTLSAHVRYFLLGKAFRCSGCWKLFPSFKATNKHAHNVHHTEPNSNLLGCPSCGVIFANKQEYRRHMLMTTSVDKKFQNRCCPLMLLTARETT